MARKTIGFNPLDQLDIPKEKKGGKDKKARKPAQSGGVRAEIQEAILKPPARKKGITGLIRSMFGR